MLAQRFKNPPEDFGEHIDMGDGWIRIPGGAAFDQKLNFSSNYSSYESAKENCEEQNYNVFVHDRHAPNAFRVHHMTPSSNWRPEFAQLPTGGTESDHYRYDLYVRQSGNIDRDESIRSPEIHSDMDGFSRIHNRKSQMHPIPTEWFPIEDA